MTTLTRTLRPVGYYGLNPQLRQLLESLGFRQDSIDGNAFMDVENPGSFYLFDSWRLVRVLRGDEGDMHVSTYAYVDMYQVRLHLMPHEGQDSISMSILHENYESRFFIPKRDWLIDLFNLINRTPHPAPIS